MSNISILGSGAWGTALALSFARDPRNRVTLWSHSESVALTLQNQRENQHFLPGFQLPASIEVTSSLDAALRDAEIVLTAVPSHHARRVFQQMAPHLLPSQVIVSATKGIEDGTYLRMSQVIAEVVAGRCAAIGVLSGPSFAQEVAAGNPTAVTLACLDHSVALKLQQAFSGPAFRVYTSDDVTGVEIGGSLKNVIAIASGMVTGLELGTNSVAALITRGLAEITRLAVACGGHAETLSGLAGLGDLVLTATGGLSRNRTVGIALGKGQTLPEIVAGLHGKVAEGIRTTHAALGLARSLDVEMPITEQVGEILYENKPPKIAMRDLLARPGRVE
jgi:glycerol-3-phosphate dehydrogenase (NAD(P)+)